MDNLMKSAAWAGVSAACYASAAYLGKHESLAFVLSDAPHPEHPQRQTLLREWAQEREHSWSMRCVTDFPKMSFWGIQVLDILASGASILGLQAVPQEAALPLLVSRAVTLAEVGLVIRLAAKIFKCLGRMTTVEPFRGGVLAPNPVIDPNAPPRSIWRQMGYGLSAGMERGADVYNIILWGSLALISRRRMLSLSDTHYVQVVSVMFMSAALTLAAAYRCWSWGLSFLEEGDIRSRSTVYGSRERIYNLFGGEEAYNALPLLNPAGQLVTDYPLYRPDEGVSIMRGVDERNRSFVTFRVNDAIVTITQRYPNGANWVINTNKAVPELFKGRGGEVLMLGDTDCWFMQRDGAPDKMEALRRYIDEARRQLPAD